MASKKAKKCILLSNFLLANDKIAIEILFDHFELLLYIGRVKNKLNTDMFHRYEFLKFLPVKSTMNQINSGASFVGLNYYGVRKAEKNIIIVFYRKDI